MPEPQLPNSPTEQAVSADPLGKKENSPLQMVAAEKQKDTESTYSELMTSMINDARKTGRYFAIFGRKTPTEDQRILVFTHSTATLGKERLFTILTREGPKALSIKRDQVDKLKALVDNQTRLAYENSNTSEAVTEGGFVKDSSGSKLLFGNPNDPSSITAANTAILDEENFLSSVKESRKAAESSYKREHEEETKPPTEAQQTLNAFNALVSSS